MTYFKFGQKVMAKRFEHSDFENALAVKGEDGEVFVVWPDCEAKWVRRSWVLTAQDKWQKAHATEIRQKRWKAAAERQGKDLAEYVYAMEQRKARAEAKRDADARKREYWRDRQRAHREKKAESDGE